MYLTKFSAALAKRPGISWKRDSALRLLQSPPMTSAGIPPACSQSSIVGWVRSCCSSSLTRSVFFSTISFQRWRRESSVALSWHWTVMTVIALGRTRGFSWKQKPTYEKGRREYDCCDCETWWSLALREKRRLRIFPSIQRISYTSKTCLGARFLWRLTKFLLTFRRKNKVEQFFWNVWIIFQ